MENIDARTLGQDSLSDAEAGSETASRGMRYAEIADVVGVAVRMLAEYISDMNARGCRDYQRGGEVGGLGSRGR